MPISVHCKKIMFFVIFLILCLVTSALAEKSIAEKVTTYKDDNGWKLLVNGESHYIKGVVWGYTPIGENYAYNLWGKSDEYVKNVLDYDCKLMKEAGVNTIRSFFNTPPKWVEYIYNEYGIMTIVNDLMGRYGMQIDGVWVPRTDYSDPRTREILKNTFVAAVRKFKDTPGVLMYALGNENNYGLEWRSGEIEDLPVGEQHREKAKFLYSLYNEIIAAAKQVDPDRPYSIVNGDIQYLDLIAEHCPDLDVLGSNVYRGSSFRDLWSEVKNKLDLPVMFMEFGSDAFNTLTDQEDQAAQADLLLAQWQEMYAKSYGNSEEGNAIGGCVFEWRDEWWKYNNVDVENLEQHDRDASWSNGAFPFDYVAGEDNVNEEWFGIMQLGYPNENGVSEAYPRMAYYMLQDIWKINPYAHDKQSVSTELESIDMHKLELEADVRSLKQEKIRNKSFYLEGGSLRAGFLVNGLDSEVEENGKDALNFSNNEMLFLDFGFRPSAKLSGDFTLNMIADVPESALEILYGHDRDPNSLEIYDFNAELKQDSFNMTAFYHVPRYHWGDKGDFFGLLWEATDIEGIDIWGQKAPFGVEFEGKKSFDGLAVILGPEIYWGANPKAMFKYTFGSDDVKLTLMHSEDLDEASETSGGAEATNKATRATTLSTKITKISGATIELGIISSGSEKINDEYDYLDNGDIIYDKVDFEDTLGAKVRVLVDGVDFGLFYVEGSYAGLVADGGEHHSIGNFDSELPNSSQGNKVTAETGLGYFIGDYLIFPRIFWRENLENANPIIDPVTTGTELFPGLNPRNLGEDPFAVLDNREAISGEIFFTFDPTPETDFYHWNNDELENAPLAFNVGFNYTEFSSSTDSEQFYYLEGDTNAAFGWGQDEENVWKVVGRFVVNTASGIKVINRLEAGFQQSTGLPGPAREYYSVEFDIDFQDRHNLSGYIKKDQWGPYDFYRQFDVIYPWQYKLDYMYKFDRLLKKYVNNRLGKGAGIGLMGIYKTLDENSPLDEYDDGANDYIFEVGTYLAIEF